MVNLASAFAAVARGVSSSHLGPYHNAVLWKPSAPTLDDGGDVVAATAQTESCSVQISAPTQAMRLADGFVETDVRVLILADALALVPDTQCTVAIADGVHAGTYALLSVTLDTLAIGYVCRARRA